MKDEAEAWEEEMRELERQDIQGIIVCCVVTGLVLVVAALLVYLRWWIALAAFAGPFFLAWIVLAVIEAWVFFRYGDEPNEGETPPAGGEK